MKVFKNYSELKNFGPTAVALGNFDGVHRGHQAILSRTVEAAAEKGCAPAVFTFSNDPAAVITEGAVTKRLMSLEEKAEAFEKAGIEYLVAVPFDETMMTSPADCFCKYILRDMLRCREAVCGFNYRFAHRASGTPETLAEYGKEYGYDVSVIPAVVVDGEVVSSTLLRKCLEEGRLEDYQAFAGRRYSISGTVVEGRRIGRDLGFPTVNLELSEGRAVPPNGVYITLTYVNQKCQAESLSVPGKAETSTLPLSMPSVTNVGKKPTIGEFSKNVETHILNFSGDLYGAEIRVEFLKMTRPERKFASLEALREQIAKDKNSALEFFGC